jgi:hypothetical protein
MNGGGATGGATSLDARLNAERACGLRGGLSLGLGLIGRAAARRGALCQSGGCGSHTKRQQKSKTAR